MKTSGNDDKCKKCAGAPEAMRIKTPRKLTRLFRIAKNHMNREELEQIEVSSEWKIELDKLTEMAPWNDLVGFTMKCLECGTKYELGCDSYYGNGSWTVTNKFRTGR